MSNSTAGPEPTFGPAGAAAALALPWLVVSSSAGFAEVTAIRAGHLIGPATATITRDQIIVIDRGTIVQVGAQARIPPDARVIDLWPMGDARPDGRAHPPHAGKRKHVQDGLTGWVVELGLAHPLDVG